MSEELKTCPFCGGDNKHMDDCYIPMLVEYVERKKFLDPDDEEKLEKAWNTRSERTCRYEHIEGTWYKTSCGKRYDGVVPPNYCPNCGAKVVE